MGQYHRAVNLTKREFIHSHPLGTGLKLREIMHGGYAGVPGALIVLLAVSNGRGGGDFSGDDADSVIGRWGGDRIAIVGDYAEDSDLKDSPVPASEIYGLCIEHDDPDKPEGGFTDITPLLCAYMERENEGKYVGDGWRRFVAKDDKVWRWKGEPGSSVKQTGTVTEIRTNEVIIQWAGDGNIAYNVDKPSEYFFPI